MLGRQTLWRNFEVWTTISIVTFFYCLASEMHLYAVILFCTGISFVVSANKDIL